MLACPVQICYQWQTAAWMVKFLIPSSSFSDISKTIYNQHLKVSEINNSILIFKKVSLFCSFMQICLYGKSL